MRLKSKRMSKRSKLKDNMIIWGVRIGIVAIIVWFIWAQENMLLATNYIYSDPGVPKALVGYKIVHISDIKNSNINVYSAVKKADPDIIVITGGYSDSKGKSNNTVKTVNKLCNIAPVYYICNPADTGDVLSSTNAINLADTNIEITPELVDARQFIKDVYGNSILKKADKGDEQAIAYVTYVQEALVNDNNKINIFGLGNYLEENGQYAARDKAYELMLNSDADYHIALLSNISYLNEVCKTGVDIGMFGGTYGINQISNTYIKGMYANSGTQLFVSGGVGTHDDMMRIFNFPSIQIITLSDGTIANNNPLENLLGKIFKDVGTIYDNDGGFTLQNTEY